MLLTQAIFTAWQKRVSRRSRPEARRRPSRAAQRHGHEARVAPAMVGWSPRSAGARLGSHSSACSRIKRVILTMLCTYFYCGRPIEISSSQTRNKDAVMGLQWLLSWWVGHHIVQAPGWVPTLPPAAGGQHVSKECSQSATLLWSAV